MKIRKSVKTAGFAAVLAMCILIVLACSKEGDGTNPIASSNEKAMERTDQIDQTTAAAQSATIQESSAVDMNQTTPQEKPAGVIGEAAETAEQGGQIVEQAAETATSALQTPIADNMEINGTVLSTQNGYVLFADTTQYQVLGKDLSEYVDRKVKITGTLEELGEKQFIHVSSVALMDGQEE